MGIFDFITGTSRAIALSFHDDAIRVASVAKSHGRVDIVYFAEQPLPAGAVDRTVIADSQLFQEALRAIKRSCHIHEPIHLIVPEDRTTAFTTRVLLDRTVPMATVIEDHLKAYTQLHDTLPTEDSICEYEVTHVSENVVSVSAVVMRKSTLRTYDELFSDVGIKIATYNSPSYIFAKHHDVHDPARASVVLSLEEEGSVIALSHGGKVYRSQYLPIGGKDLVQVVRDFVAMEYPDAKQALHKHGFLPTHPDKNVYKAIHETFLPIANEIDTFATEYLRESQVKDVNLYVTGPYALIPGIQDYFANLTRLATKETTPHHMILNNDSKSVPAIHLNDFLKFAPTIFCAYEYISR